MSGDNDDFKTYLDELGPVRRIRSNRIEKRRSQVEPRPRMREADEQAVLDQLTDLHPDDALIETGEELLW
ncbi:MAG: SMR domain protein, partial [Xanthomonadaceae bacterium]|nr:SMR domain protein [Xanthomonadaceae bacterium]